VFHIRRCENSVTVKVLKYLIFSEDIEDSLLFSYLNTKF
jgi:hypothetical protein